MRTKVKPSMSKSRNRALGILLLFFLIAFPVSAVHAAPAEYIDAIVIKVLDGNTIQAVATDKKKINIKLYGIDAPVAEVKNKRTGAIEKPGQPYGEEARDYLTSMVLDKKARIKIVNGDRQKKVSAVVWVGKHNMSLEMIKAGMAEAYIENLEEPYRTQFIVAEKKAKTKSRGIWSQGKDYVRPSVFRRKMKARAG